MYRSRNNPEHIYGSGLVQASGPQGPYQALAFYKSSDGGATWATVRANSSNSYPRAIAVDPVREKEIFMSCIDYTAGHGGVVRSVDGGASWNRVRTGSLDYIEDLEFNPLNPKEVYLCSGNSGLYRSDDGGVGWTKVANEGTESILITGKSPQEIFVTQQYVVRRSRDKGKTWEEIDLGTLQFNKYMSLAYNEGQKILYVGTEGGGILKKQL